MAREVVYLIDTNVLVDWLGAYVPSAQRTNSNFKPETAKRIRCFMEHNENTVFIPDLVWSEFLGTMLHKDLDVSGTLDDLKRRFRDLESVIAQMEFTIHERPQLQFFSWQLDGPPGSPFSNGAEYVRDLDLIDARTFDWLARLGSKKEIKTEKLLDGMDGVIVAYLDGLAGMQPDRMFVLYTGDFRVVRFFGRLRQYWKPFGFAQNTSVIYSRSESIRTRGREIPADRLLHQSVREISFP